jgi:hypothetical protein
MTEYKNQTFRKLYDRGGALCLENMRFESCMFESCEISLTKDINLRSTVRNVSIENCAANGCGIGPTVFENVSVEGLATNDLLIIWAATFQHVKLSGAIGKVKINSAAHFVDTTEATQGPFTRAREALYRSIDWALDITGARFKGFDATGIPARLFRRDPESQAVVTRDRVTAEGGQRFAKAEGNPWLPWIRGALRDGSSDGVLVTPLGAPKKRCPVCLPVPEDRAHQARARCLETGPCSASQHATDCPQPRGIPSGGPGAPGSPPKVCRALQFDRSRRGVRRSSVGRSANTMIIEAIVLGKYSGPQQIKQHGDASPHRWHGEVRQDRI